ncbi:3-hydroxyacyl-CoA dehydrogenase [Chitinophaga sp. SYP-B3965]|uniref:3-hydroxyacyl-CoA dehydrogenase family protein n=1 Tax=Chitinophaga sp. SYP-B3965 TaxID=2663120 RepID=UPI001299A612|nr:3-hydroxyacyl-CoA dehydrogenase family protein [Chitinophaga sp. SYP-B3965]MRG46308.1 3-hydroxyacyl-CoA dehydrogenase [Chitinophaga sp. SYP-B3965]
MKILITGDPQRWEELQNSKDFKGHDVRTSPEPTDMLVDLVIDLSLDEHPRRVALYASFPSVPVLACLVKLSTAELQQFAAGLSIDHIYGCNFLPGFISMPILEIAGKPDALMQQLGWIYESIAPTIGMVTPRVISMIINEAYFTAEEGTASREDIDTSMKLGTNYPMGPFEWSKKIGIRHVYEVLQAVYQHTGNERYKICSLLQQEYEALR